MMLFAASPRGAWSEPMSNEEALEQIAAFVPERGRYRNQGDPWGRWFRQPRLLERLDAKFQKMRIGTLVQVQRQSDREFLDVQKVTD